LAFRRVVSDGNYGNYLYVIDAGARTVAALSLYIFSADPALSPDGTRIAYAAYGEQAAYDISTKRITGADSQRVSAFEGQEFAPSWSPDGQDVYFASLVAGGIYRQSVSSSPLTPIPVLTGDSDPCLGGSGDSPVSASASGRLAFSCVSGVYTANDVGSDLRALLLLPATPPGRADRFHAPTWSPDGQWLAFLRVFQDTTPGAPPLTLAVGVVRADGSASRFVVSMATAPTGSLVTGRNKFSLAWSPDGSRLAFNVLAGEASSHIYVVDIDGTGLMQLTTRADAYDHSLTWVQ
jgi:Tol biopolymer transport system component